MISRHLRHRNSVLNAEVFNSVSVCPAADWTDLLNPINSPQKLYLACIWLNYHARTMAQIHKT